MVLGHRDVDEDVGLQGRLVEFPGPEGHAVLDRHFTESAGIDVLQLDPIGGDRRHRRGDAALSVATARVVAGAVEQANLLRAGLEAEFHQGAHHLRVGVGSQLHAAVPADVRLDHHHAAGRERTCRSRPGPRSYRAPTAGSPGLAGPPAAATRQPGRAAPAGRTPGGCRPRRRPAWSAANCGQRCVDRAVPSWYSSRLSGEQGVTRQPQANGLPAALPRAANGSVHPLARRAARPVRPGRRFARSGPGFPAGPAAAAWHAGGK